MRNMWPRGRIALLPAAIAAIVLALIVAWALDDPRSADAAQNNEFSISIDKNGDTTPDCSTAGGSSKCQFDANDNFSVQVRLNKISLTDGDGDTTAGYAGFQARIDHPASINVNGFTINWPGCAFSAGTPGNGQFFGCAGGANSESTFVGVLTTVNYTCKGSATLTLVHNFIVGTALTDDFGSGVANDSDGASESLSINCVLPPTATSTPTVTPTPTATNSPTPTNTPTQTPLPSQLGDVTITKTDSPDPVPSAGTITYGLNVRNIGLLPLTGVTVVDTLPAGTSFVFASPACAHFAGTVTCTVGSLAANNAAPGGPDEKTFVIVVTAPVPAQDTLITNHVTVTAADEPFANTGNNKDVEQTVVLAPRADLLMQKTDDPDPVPAGGAIVYELKATNIGPAVAENVTMVDTLPAGAGFVSASPACGAPVGQVVTCNVGNLAPQAQAIVEIEITAPPVTFDSVILNTAIANADNELFILTGNNLDIETTAVIAPPPDLALTKTGPGAPIRRATYYNYSLTVTNNGAGDAFNVIVTDTLPAAIVQGHPRYTTFANAKGANCSDIGNHVVQCTIPKVAANGGQVKLTLNVRAPTVVADASILNVASATDPDESDATPGNNTDTENTTLLACFDVNGDGVVAIVDISIIVSKVGTVVGDPGYDILYDFNGDGAVSIVDLALVIAHFGEFCA